MAGRGKGDKGRVGKSGKYRGTVEGERERE